MSARKLSRFTGLVFVLAAFVGGAGASVLGAEHGTGGPTISTGGSASDLTTAALIDSTGLLADFDWT